MSDLQEQAHIKFEANDELNEEKEEEENSAEDMELQKKVDKPIVFNSWSTAETENIIAEIKNFEVVPSRPLLKLQFIKKRKEFGEIRKLGDREASEAFCDIKPTMDINFNLGDKYVKRKTLDIGLQGANLTTEIGTQTTWYRKINTFTETAKEDLTINEVDEPSLNSLMKNYEVLNELESALQQNEMINVFQDDFAVLPQEELSTNDASKLTYDITELKSVSFHPTVGKRVSCIRLMPKYPDLSSRYVCVCYRDNYTFDEKMELFTRSLKYTLLLWDIEDVSALQPVLEIQSPIEIITFQFHPKNFILIGGGANGQIIRWDLEKGIREAGILNRKSNNPKQESDKSIVINPYRFSALSSISDPNGLTNIPLGESKKLVCSHKSGIVSIQWVPNNFEVEKRGLYQTIPNKTPGEYHQFVSLSEDGQVLVWDFRFPPENQGTEYQWKAMHAVQLYRPDGMMGGSQLVFQRDDNVPIMLGASDEGDIFFFDWTQKATEESPKIEYVTRLWQYERSYRPCIGLQLSPIPGFEDIFLSIHDYHFCIWKAECDVPIFSSSILENAHITCGCFSPSRPGVIIIGRSDGYLDFWDLTDQSHTYIMHHLVVSVGISTLHFDKEMNNILNIGDNEGSLRVFALPQNLTKKIGNEEQTMRQFYERELKRVEYFRAKFEIRKEELMKQPQDDEGEKEEEKKETLNEEDEKLEKEYRAFAEAYLDELKGVPPKGKEGETKK